MDDWSWEQFVPWLEAGVELPVGPRFASSTDRRRTAMVGAAARPEPRQTAGEAGVRRRFAPDQLRHARAVEMAREGVPLIVSGSGDGSPRLGRALAEVAAISVDVAHRRR